VGYRRLTASERAALVAQGCTADSWERIEVADPFRAERVRGVRFGGEVRIGTGALLQDVRRLANYELEAGVVVRDVGLLAVEGESAFGNGTKINVLNEAGGRTLTLHDRLSAQEAYLAVMHRHRPALAAALEALAAARVGTRRAARGQVKSGSRIEHCGTVRAVSVGPHAVLEGAARLEDGTVRGSAEDPAIVGAGVQARHFIVLSGSHVEGGAQLDSCFVGQGVRIHRQFSAEHSAFFANAECDHGEAVAVFAGPFTVSHHKSSLLIGCALSFCNVGSGTNMSNHMYKLGPLHQGILERGVKTGSGAYLLWPARVGPFSTVTGKHYANFDLADLPFSYITEDGGRTVVAPGVNLINVGIRRDAEKWVARDRRRDPDRLDRVSHGLLNPYTVSRVRRGLALLRRLAAAAPRERELVGHAGAHLRRLLLKSGVQFYELALDLYLGERLAARLAPLAAAGEGSRLRELLHSPGAGGEWWDLAGLIAPAADVNVLEDELERGTIGSPGQLEERFRQLEEALPEREWAWCLGLLAERRGRPAAVPADLIPVLAAWVEASTRVNQLALADAGKEFGERSRVGFGADGGPTECEADFRAVRGELSGNPYVRQIEGETVTVARTAARLTAWLRGSG